jgi:hypothetical protein
LAFFGDLQIAEFPHTTRQISGNSMVRMFCEHLGSTALRCYDIYRKVLPSFAPLLSKIASCIVLTPVTYLERSTNSVGTVDTQIQLKKGG